MVPAAGTVSAGRGGGRQRPPQPAGGSGPRRRLVPGLRGRVGGGGVGGRFAARPPAIPAGRRGGSGRPPGRSSPGGSRGAEPGPAAGRARGCGGDGVPCAGGERRDPAAGARGGTGTVSPASSPGSRPGPLGSSGRSVSRLSGRWAGESPGVGMPGPAPPGDPRLCFPRAGAEFGLARVPHVSDSGLPRLCGAGASSASHVGLLSDIPPPPPPPRHSFCQGQRGGMPGLRRCPQVPVGFSGHPPALPGRTGGFRAGTASGGERGPSRAPFQKRPLREPRPSPQGWGTRWPRVDALREWLPPPPAPCAQRDSPGLCASGCGVTRTGITPARCCSAPGAGDACGGGAVPMDGPDPDRGKGSCAS